MLGSRGRKEYTLVLIILVAAGIEFFMNSPSKNMAVNNSENKIIYVAWDGSGDFNCDGINDEVEINRALELIATDPELTTVYLRGPNKYIIADTLLIGDNIILEGDSSAVLKLVDNANWPQYKPMIKQRNDAGNHDITIRGFEIDGNHDKNTDKIRGAGYYTLIHLKNSYNITLYDMYLHDGHSDGLKVEHDNYKSRPTNIKFYNNHVYKLGHDALYCIRVSNVEAYDNVVTCRTNSALRVFNTNHVKFHDNIINSERHGGPGIEIQKKGSVPVMDDIEIYRNVIYETYGSGIWMFGYGSYDRETGKNVHIHHNIFYNTALNARSTKTAGIAIQGFHNTLIENNVIDGSYNAGVGYNNYYGKAPSQQYTTIVRNNIILDTQPHPRNKKNSGYGVDNYLPETHTFVLENNCLYNNAAGDYRNAASDTDIHADPLFVNPENHDYRLKSTAGRWDGDAWVKDSVDSPCIDAGNPASDYSYEVQKNGGRINIGRYGNTGYASRSEKAGLVGQTRLDEETNPENPENRKKEEHPFVLSQEDQTFSSPADTRGMIDCRLKESSPDTVLTDYDYLDVGERNGAGRYRGLIWGDLSAYNRTDTITEATLSLYWYFPENKTREKDTVVEVYRPAGWDRDFVTWNVRKDGVSWKNPGGDWFDKNDRTRGNSPYAAITLKGSKVPDERYYEVDVTELVQAYVSGEYENTGFLLKAREERNNYIAFYSLSQNNENQRIRLDITHEPESKKILISEKSSFWKLLKALKNLF